ncbi:hypothetical protein ISF_09894 [Cordyceps fumosorosea ARSEF 2679]|uniref:F-box domain-containing protein n=1 Tax=Cordyceps fumosorosea (strain ARSEF 2679) TaxID=1081104 RepID=A0A166ZVJ6_CORFA|nr:hypothetical protein ISF_09894 [Cordyceps fumosorosea ARSEF 2679]OAA38285.1 hypothetical protein ISF_09894 [Cordyceps fumosorosea ARSEF 2679]
MANANLKSLTDVFVSVVAENIVSYLALTDLIALQGVCRMLRASVQSRLDYRFNINIFLKDFIEDATAFRCELGKADALIIRDSALNFLENQHRQFKQLDLLVQVGRKADTLINYLCVEESYFTLPEHPGTAQLHGHASALSERTIKLGKMSFEEIHVTTTTSFPIHALLNTCFMTTELNFATWNKVFSLFPEATLARHKTYVLRELDDDFGTRLAQFAHQGWTTRDMLWLKLAAHKPCGVGSRRVGDTYSVSISVTPLIESAEMTPDFVVEHAAFDVLTEETTITKRRSVPQYTCSEMSIYIRKLESLALRHHFTVGQSNSDSWSKFVNERLERWAKIELLKIPRTTRGFDVHGPSVPMGRIFRRPKGWDYADDQLPVWYRNFQEVRQAEEKHSSGQAHTCW